LGRYSSDFGTTSASGVPLSVPALNSPAQRSGAAKSKEEVEGKKAQQAARKRVGGQGAALRASKHVGILGEGRLIRKRAVNWINWAGERRPRRNKDHNMTGRPPRRETRSASSV